MISVLAQERLLGAALGSVVAGYVAFEQRRSIYKTIAEYELKPSAQSEVTKPSIPQAVTHSQIAHLWNKTVDQTLGPVIESLSSHEQYREAHCPCS